MMFPVRVELTRIQEQILYLGEDSIKHCEIGSELGRGEPIKLAWRSCHCGRLELRPSRRLWEVVQTLPHSFPT